MLTSLLPQRGRLPLDLALNGYSDEVRTWFAEHTIITDDNKNELLLACARIGLVPRLRALLQAGANAAHINKVRVRTPSSKKLAKTEETSARLARCWLVGFLPHPQSFRNLAG